MYLIDSSYFFCKPNSQKLVFFQKDMQMIPNVDSALLILFIENDHE